MCSELDPAIKPSMGERKKRSDAVGGELAEDRSKSANDPAQLKFIREIEKTRGVIQVVGLGTEAEGPGNAANAGLDFKFTKPGPDVPNQQAASANQLSILQANRKQNSRKQQPVQRYGV